MSTNSDAITITLPHRLLEHSEAIHIRRMRAAIWLYLVLLARLPNDVDTIEVEPAKLAIAMGLPEGTIRSWIGHLRKGRYVEATRLNGAVRIVVKRPAQTIPEAPAPRPRFFTVERIVRALGERSDTEAIAKTLDLYSDYAIRRALAGALAVPEREIRRSRTALFLYLLKKNSHGSKNEHHPRA